MKRLLLAITALLISFGCVWAKQKREIRSDLVGVWQLVNVVDGQWKFMPILKMINPNGTFSTMRTFSAQGGGGVYQEGTFKILNDSVYEECIERHLVREEEGKTYPIKYRLEEDKRLLLLKMNGGGEGWMRVSDKDLVAGEGLQVDLLNVLGYYPTTSNVAAAQHKDHREEKICIHDAFMTSFRDKQDEISRRLAKNEVTREEALKLREALVAAQGRVEGLIEDMAARYATETECFDGFDSQFAFFVRSGQLKRADSLLSAQEKVLAKGDARLEDLADLFYKRHDYYSLQYMSDSAAHYLERRAMLDTTKVEWQYAAGRYAGESMGDFVKALSYYRRALFYATEQFGELSEWAAKSNHSIGRVYCSMGNSEQSLASLESALNIYRKAHRKSQSDIAAVITDMGGVYFSTKDYKSALSYWDEAFAINVAVWGYNHPSVANCALLAGNAFLFLGDCVAAFSCWERALTIYRSYYGEIHFVVADAINHIGSHYASLNNREMAVPYWKSALEIYKTILGENHPSVLLKLDELGNFYYLLGDYSSAISYWESKLEVRKSLFGERHPIVATDMHNIGVANIYLWKFKTALSYLEKALEIRQTVLEENHIDVAASLYNIGVAYAYLQSHYEALSCWDAALKIREAVLGKEHPEVMIVVDNIEAVDSIIMSEYIYTIIFADDEPSMATFDEPNDCFLLEFDNWSIKDNTISLINKAKELKGKPKSLLIMKNGVIQRIHISDREGELTLKNVGKVEKQRIAEDYEEWKKKSIIH